MIYFHEGLPGSGKSYEAMVHHMIPALRNRRRVVTNIHGINYEKIAGLVGTTVDSLREILVSGEPKDGDDTVDWFIANAGKDSLLVWDEIQNSHPSGRTQLPTHVTKFITEHRHDGLDIILMGQDRDDCHNLWRRRIETVVYFLKLSAVGKENSYKWEILQKQRKNKFVATGSGIKKYEKQYFGTYASHTKGTEHTKAYQTSRTNFLKNKSFTVVVPCFLLVLVWAVYTVIGFFNPANASASSKSVSTYQRPKEASTNVDDYAVSDSPKETSRHKPEEPQKPDLPPPPIDYFDQMAESYRVRRHSHRH